MSVHTASLLSLADDKLADAASHSRRSTSPAFLLSSVLQHTTHPPPLPSSLLPPPPPPPYAVDHTRRSSIPPPLPQWFLSDSSTPLVHPLPSQSQQQPYPTSLLMPPPSPPSRTTVISVNTPPSAGSGGRHGRNQSMGSVPFFASAFSSISPRSKAASTVASPTAAASPSASTPATRRTPPSTVTSLAPSTSAPTTASPASPPPPTSRDILDALRLLCSGRVFRSYTAAPPSSDTTTAPLQCDWYLFFDIEDSPFDSIRSRGQSTPVRSTKRSAAEEHKEQTAFRQSAGSESVMDQRGMLFYNVVGAGQPQKQKLPQQRISLSSITSVLLGKQSAVLLHPSLARVREDCCFSLALADGRELCLSSKSPIMLVSFLMALKRLMAANCMDEDVLSVRAVIRRGLIDGVLTAALTPSNSQLHPSDNSSISQPSSPRASVGGLLLPPAAQGRMGRVSPTHVRSRSQNTAVLFKQLADVSYPPANAPIRSLSPLPVQSRTTSPRRPSAVKVTSVDSGSSNPLSSNSSVSSSSSASPAASAFTSPSPSAAPPSNQPTPLTASVPSLPTASTTPTPTAPATPHHKPPPLSSLLSPGDPTTKFTLLGRLGQGRSGTVYKALYRPLSTHVAIKIVTLSSTQPQSSELIAAEVDLLSRSASDYMVGYVGCWRKGSEVWVVQEYMVGGSLSDFMLISAHTLLELEVCAVMHHTLLALQMFHNQRRIHRDVKASNILLNAAGQAKLSDVGTAIQLSAHHIAHTSIGSPYWMAPEVLSSDHVSGSYDEKADIWSLGITALELAYGDPPHHQLSVHQVMRTIVEREPPSLDRSKGGGNRWSDEFAEFAAQCLQKEPSKRPTAGSLLQSRFIRRMELEEAREVLSAMWRAWGERIEAYRAMEVEIEQKQRAQLASDVKRAEQRRRQQVAAQLSGFDMDGVGLCRMGPSDWNGNDVEYSVSSSQPRYSSHHSRSISPSSSSSSGNHRLHSQSGDREPISPSLSSRRTGGAGGANSGLSGGAGGVGGAGGGGSSSSFPRKLARSMSFSASFNQYGARDIDGDEDEGLGEPRKEEDDDEDEPVTVIDYSTSSTTATPSHASRTPRKQRPPVPTFPRLSPASSSSSSSPPVKPLSASPSLPSPIHPNLSRASSFPVPLTRSGSNSNRRGRLDSYDVDEDDTADTIDRSESGGSSTSASRSSRGGERRDVLYSGEFSSRSGGGRYGGGGDEEGEGEEFSRQFVEEDRENEAVAGGGMGEDAMTAEEEEELEEAYRAVIHYSQ